MLSTPSMFNDPAVQTSSASPDGYIQPNLGHGLRVWWAYYWPTTLFSTVLILMVNSAVKYLYENTALPAVLFKYFGLLNGYILTYAVGFFIFKYVLGKTFRQFRIALRPQDESSSIELPATFSRTVRVWWTFVWRTLLYTAASFVVVMMPMSVFIGMFRPGPLVAIVLSAGLGFVIGAALSLFVIYSNILDEVFGDFRVCLLPRKEDVLAVTPVESLPHI